MDIKTIAIIGCGAAAVSFLRSFVQQCNLRQLKHIKLIIFEPASTPGVGLAYQNDLDNLLINRPAQTMSANLDQPDEFFQWIRKSNPFSLEGKVVKESQLIYPSRKTFGHYLNELLEKIISEAYFFSISITIIKDTVTQLRKGIPISIITKNNGTFLAYYVLLATGNNLPRDLYHLNNTPKYINSPYPLYKNLPPIGSSETVGILGNSLTAIDITLSLDYLGHNSNIIMLSRLHANPRVRSEFIAPYQFNFLKSSIIYQKKDNITLREVLRIFRKELKQHDIFWKQFFVEDNQSSSFNELISLEIEASKSPRKWQDILSATNEVIEYIWHAFDYPSKEIFTQCYQRIWLKNRSPIPPENARLLFDLTEQKKLSTASGLEHIYYDNKIQKYVATTKKCTLFFDWVINATGPSRHALPEDGLIYNLIRSGIAREHPFGGIDVNFNSSSLISDPFCVNKNIRVLGHNTIGVYNYTSSLEMIAKKADKIARDLVFLIKEENLNGQDKMVNTPSVDRLGYFA